MFKVLVCEFGCDVDAFDVEGFIAFTTAAAFGYVECVKMLVSLGVDVRKLMKFGVGVMY